MNQFLWGAIVMACGVAGLFFLRFYRSTRDRLFLWFAVSFWLLALNWLGLLVFHPSNESGHYVYLIRLAAFLLLGWAIVDKNRQR